MAGTVARVKAGNDLKAGIVEAVAGLGGFARFLAQGDKVLIKPNFNTSDAFPGSSDPAFVAAFADACREHGAGEVIVADSSTYFADTARVMDEIGVFELAKTRSWLRVVDLDQGAWVKREIPGARYLSSVRVPELLSQVDKVFFCACLKTHFLARYTGALKLAVGLMEPGERRGLHFGHLQEKIGELAAAVSPDLVVMDARKCFINGGPGKGTVREPGLILAAADRVALDIEGVRVIQSYPGNGLEGVVPEELPQIKRAIEMGVDRGRT